MYPHGYGNPHPSEHPYPPHQNQQEHQDFYQHPYHPAQHYPPAYSSPSFSPPSSFHYPPGPGGHFDNNSPPDAPHPDYRQYSFHPPPPSHQSPYSPPPDTYPPQYGVPHAASFEARHHSSPAQDVHALPTFGERILSSLESALGLPGSQRSSENTYARSASDQSHSPSISHHSSSHHSSYHEENKPPFENTYEGPGFDYSHSPSIPNHIAPYIENKDRSAVARLDSTNSTPPPTDVELPKGQLVRIFCKSNRSFNLAVKGGRLTMVDADSENESQQWIRDDKYSIRVRDSSGHPAFMLINKASKMVLKHASGKCQEVQLAYYSPDIQDDDLFWTESQDFGEGFKSVRMASDTHLNLSVGSGNKIEDGSRLILDTWHKKDTQLWKVFPL